MLSLLSAPASGASAADPGSENRYSATSPQASVGAWKRTDLRPVTQPAVVGDRVLLYVVDGHRLRVIALDARSGATVWSDQAFQSGVTNGVPPYLTVADRKVIYVRGGYGFEPELVAADVRTGRRAWRSDLIVIASWPHVCHDDQTAVCVAGFLVTGRSGTSQLAFDAHTGKLRSTTLVSTSDDGREIGDSLFDPGRRNPETLAATRRAKVTWRHPLARIFPQAGASTDWGWDLDRIDGGGLFVGSVASAPVKRTNSKIVVDLSRSMTAGFRILDGSTLWRETGTAYACGLLPCPGRDPAPFSSPSSVQRETRVGVRLRESGTVTASPTNPLPVASSDARVTLEGFEPETGRTRWEFDAGHDVGLITFRRLPPQLASTTIVLPDSGGNLTAVDLADGARRQVAATETGWCSAPIIYKLRLYRLEMYVGQFELYSCNAAGVRLRPPRTAPGFVGAIGGRIGQRVVWSDRRGVYTAQRS